MVRNEEERTMYIKISERTYNTITGMFAQVNLDFKKFHELCYKKGKTYRRYTKSRYPKKSEAQLELHRKKVLKMIEEAGE